MSSRSTSLEPKSQLTINLDPGWECPSSPSKENKTKKESSRSKIRRKQNKEENSQSKIERKQKKKIPDQRLRESKKRKKILDQTSEENKRNMQKGLWTRQYMIVAPLYLPLIGDKRKAKIGHWFRPSCPFRDDDSRLYSFFFSSAQNKIQTTTRTTNIIYIYTHTHIHIFGEGTDPENNRKTYFSVTRGSALDNRGHMNSARQWFHGSPNKIGEWRICEQR